MTIGIGIDLGTTNSVLAVCDGNGRPKTIENEAGETITPSVIAIDEQTGRLLVGDEAAQLYNNGLAPGAALFKRRMGDDSPFFEFDGNSMTPVDLSAQLLTTMIAEAEPRLGFRPSKAVVTVPAYFQNAEREATREAVTRAGLECLQLINEPTAAAIAYRVDAEGAGKRVLVYDLGGGTFDVTILDTGDLGAVLQSKGDPNLGGADWDSALFRILLEEAEAQLGPDVSENSRFQTKLRWEAETAKKRLSQTTRARLLIAHEGAAFRTEVTRDAFEEATGSLVAQTIEVTQSALDAESFSPDDIDEVLLVGGSTRMPMIAEALERHFGRPPLKALNPDHAVAHGAALKAASLTAGQSELASMPVQVADIVAVNDITNFSLGVIAESEAGDRYVNSVMIAKGASLPAEGRDVFEHAFYAEGDGPSLELFVTQGEGDAPDDVSYLGYYTLASLPSAEIGRRCRIEIRYAYDMSGIGSAQVRLEGGTQWSDFTRHEVPHDVPARFRGAPPKSEPATVMIWIDVSGSMSGPPIEEARNAAIEQFAENAQLDGAEIGFGVVSDASIVVLNPTTDRRALRTAIASIDVNHDGAGFCNAADPFLDVERLLGHAPGARTAVVLADGVWEGQDQAIKGADACKKLGIEIICVAYGGADLEFLHKLSSTRELSFHAAQGDLGKTFGTIARRVSSRAELISR